jgi:hypothetical protein
MRIPGYRGQRAEGQDEDLLPASGTADDLVPGLAEAGNDLATGAGDLIGDVPSGIPEDLAQPVPETHKVTEHESAFG